MIKNKQSQNTVYARLSAFLGNRRTIIAVFVAVFTLSSTFAPRRSDALFIGIAMQSTVVAIFGGLAIVKLSGISAVSNPPRARQAKSLAFAAMILNEEQGQPHPHLSQATILADMEYYDAEIAHKIKYDLSLIDESRDKEFIDIPAPIVRFLEDDGTPSEEELRSSECGLIVEVRKHLSQMIRKLGPEYKDHNASLDTAKYLLEKSSSAFESPLSIDEVQDRAENRTCVYAVEAP